ncbi:MAG: amidohydrolase [Flavobacteriaceae bacterium]|nr:amidohydrolase [Flavobacteriaceae bacterium]
MQDTLKIAIIQSDLIWEDPVQNRTNFTKKIKSISEAVDIILLPEMFTSGFTMTPENVAETMNGESIQWMRDISSKRDAAVGGSLVISENGNYYNRFVFAQPDGTIKTYDKRHTFTFAGEDKVYTSGKEKCVIEYLGWKICLMICYDLRFPVWSRNTEAYDLLVYVANWPKPRISAWDTLLQARAIENMCYCVGVNRVGEDVNNNEYPGHSALYDGLGKCLTQNLENTEQIEIISIHKNHIQEIRNTFHFLDDKDDFSLVK